MKINKTTIRKILKKLSPESTKYAVRDISFLSCSIFIETHLVSFKKFFNFNNFSIIFFYVRPDKNVVFHRSGCEYDDFSVKVGKKFLRDSKFVKKTVATLIEMTDDIYEFIRKNKTRRNFLDNREYFFKLYRDFFAFHQGVYWPGEYLMQNRNCKNRRKVDKLKKIFDKAYQYNEMVVPNVEKYFSMLGIESFSWNEINEKFVNKKYSRRSLMLLDRQVLVISSDDAKKIDKVIKDNYDRYLQSLKNINGLAVSGGLVIGQVRLIENLSDLKHCQDGDILVVTQTRPQYNIFIKKVGAIVTDEGGFLCHASILAREHKIACIVGTKNATKILKDGDIVEVNANHGWVRIKR